MEKLKCLKFNRESEQYEINGKTLDACTRVEFDFVAGKYIRVIATFDECPNIRVYECDSWGEECDIEIILKNMDFSNPKFKL